MTGLSELILKLKAINIKTIVNQNLWISLKIKIAKVITKKNIIAPLSGSKKTNTEGIRMRIATFNKNINSDLIPVLLNLPARSLNIMAKLNYLFYFFKHYI